MEAQLSLEFLRVVENGAIAKLFLSKAGGITMLTAHNAAPGSWDIH